MKDPVKGRYRHPPHRTAPTSFRLDPELLDRLKRYAKAEGITHTDALHELVDVALQVIDAATGGGRHV